LSAPASILHIGRELMIAQELESADHVASTMAVILPVRITVCGFAELTRQCDAGVSHVLSILDPGSPVPLEIGVYGADQRLELRFHDVIENVPDMAPPSPEHVHRLLAFGREVITEEQGDLHLLIHCHAGFSRSPAALALLLAQARPSLPAAGIAEEILRLRPTAWPNLRLIELGDGMLGRHGEIVEAAAQIYRKRLAQQPGLADMLIANGRVREVEAARG
jgi:predicted protein tyrosine phosphatase